MPRLTSTSHGVDQITFTARTGILPLKLRLLSTLALVSLMTACATTPPDPSLLNNARAAIERAEQSGAREYAPIELRAANLRLDQARSEMDRGQGDNTRRLADEAEIEAQLALARTQAAIARAELAQRQRDLEQLRQDLIEAFGEEAIEP